MFSKVLIANRGEIAVRIAQTCREMGIATVAIYSAADRTALHVRSADEAYLVGPPSPRESYLNIESILRVARESRAEAIHPGYGFLAENPGFARRVQQAGLVWVGPPSEVIARMGDKVAARQLAESVGVPAVPGYVGDDQTLERMLGEAQGIGYPVMIKAATGGGGRGMRAVPSARDLPAALEGAKREARSTFGDDRVFLEKLIQRPRHVEIQIAVDSRGSAIYLGERDCSVQRRHQKVIEESPSPALTRELRMSMGADAVRVGRAGKYVNVGTVEFLFGGDHYYFLEMNTRIQVEHPVTEMVTGLDLVRLQLEIAAGRPLPFSQLEVQLSGHAIEARLYAEDADHGFLPATGKLAVYRLPEGIGIRNDVGVYEGCDIPPYYDPMLAKLIVHAETRGEAVARLTAALEDYAALGVTTNLSFLHWLSGQRDFRAGRVDVDFVDREWVPDEAPAPLPNDVLIGAAGAELAALGQSQQYGRSAEDDRYSPWRQSGSWRQCGAERRFAYRYGEQDHVVAAVECADALWRISTGGESREVRISTGPSGALAVREGERVMRFAVARLEDGLAIAWNGQNYHLHRPAPSWEAAGSSGGGPEAEGLSAPLPGTVVKVAVSVGQRVAAQEPLVVLEAMKIEHVIHAPHEGVVQAILYQEGDLVPAGSPVVRLEAP